VIRWVVFDIGETLVDETKFWSDWADWLAIPRLTLFAVLGAVIARGGRHREAFEILRPGFDLASEAAAREAAGEAPPFGPGDLYPDVLSSLSALRARGFQIGAAGNQPLAAEAALRSTGASVDFVASSDRWGVDKPAPAFFQKVVEATGSAAGEIAYVGDRLDNDVIPALAAGLRAVFVRRGPWAFIQGTIDLPNGAFAIDSLAELPGLLSGENLAMGAAVTGHVQQL
jgi:FMN phosphatase YigB (HAD superfamily)